MIVTVTLNAALDRTLTVPNFQRGQRHRASGGLTLAGGKGINIARALKRLDVPVVATGLAGGLTGTRIVEELTGEAILNDFVRIADESRTSTAVVDPTASSYTEMGNAGRVGFAAVGRFNEFDNLRRGGIQFADTRGYAYDRRDVTGRQLANVYAQTLGTIFTEQAKPYEVELCVAEVAHFGETKPPELYRITYDGSIADEPHFVVMGGTTEPISTALNESYTENASLSEAARIAIDALTAGGGNGGSEPRTLGPSTLEVAILDVNRPRRAFRRITGSALEALLPEQDSGSADQKSDGD